jgi:phosphonate transport system substrate-binding protein
MKRRNFLLYSTLFVVSGCTATTTQSGNNSSNTASTSTFKKPEKLKFAVSDVKGMEDLEKDYGALRTLLEEVLETKVEFFPVDSYIAAASALQLDQVDMVFTGPSEYVVMRARTNAVPVVAIQRERYFPVVIVRADSGIKSIKDLKGKTVAMWEVGSTSGYLGPTKLLIDAGLDPKRDLTIELMAKKGLPALKDGKVDAWAGSIRRYDKFLESEKLTEADFPIIAKGPTLPSDPFVVNSKLGDEFVAEAKKRLFQNQEKLLAAIAPADGAKFTGASMVDVKDSDFDMIREVYRAVGQGSFLQTAR